MSKKLILLLSVIVALNFSTVAQNLRVDPPYWWAGMKSTSLQLLINGKEIKNYKPEINYQGVTIKQVHLFENSNYMAIDLILAEDVMPRKFNILFKSNKKLIYKYEYELKVRRDSSANRTGYSQKDIIYLLMPDRFANGDKTNDNMPNMKELANRSNRDGRHGGDIAGIINNLNYFTNLGITSIWINPLLENNMPEFSYHGYAITDFYKIDPRFGTNNDYLNLVEKAHEKGLKIIQDMVFNHCGSHHHWFENLPEKSFVNQWPEYTRSNYRSETLMDPHASTADRELMSKGWFDHSMPDLNQKNPFVAKYLIQNSIWWIENANLDGIRMDTYPYSDQAFMNRWLREVKKEYPNFTILGEVWLQTEAHTSYFTNTSLDSKHTVGGLESVTDFPLMYAMQNALNEKDGWTEGLARIYITLSNDFLYCTPTTNVIFLDNHDVSRILSVYKNDLAKWKMGMGMLMTLRGTPMLYYGTEILMKGDKKDGDAALRHDFPGGWLNDSTNAFTQKNMSAQEIEAFDFTKKLIAIRQSSEALQTGHLTHYIPKSGVYVYFKYSDNESFMIILNNNDKEKTLKLDRFKESFSDYKFLKNAFDNQTIEINESLLIQPMSVNIFKLQ